MNEQHFARRVIQSLDSNPAAPVLTWAQIVRLVAQPADQLTPQERQRIASTWAYLRAWQKRGGSSDG